MIASKATFARGCYIATPTECSNQHQGLCKAVGKMEVSVTTMILRHSFVCLCSYYVIALLPLPSTIPTIAESLAIEVTHFRA